MPKDQGPVERWAATEKARPVEYVIFQLRLCRGGLFHRARRTYMPLELALSPLSLGTVLDRTVQCQRTKGDKYRAQGHRGQRVQDKCLRTKGLSKGIVWKGFRLELLRHS